MILIYSSGLSMPFGMYSTSRLRVSYSIAQSCGPSEPWEEARASAEVRAGGRPRSSANVRLWPATRVGFQAPAKAFLRVGHPQQLCRRPVDLHRQFLIPCILVDHILTASRANGIQSTVVRSSVAEHEPARSLYTPCAHQTWEAVNGLEDATTMDTNTCGEPRPSTRRRSLYPESPTSLRGWRRE
jgi:hypothetical protein